MKIEFETKYNVGDTVYYTDESFDTIERKVVILELQATYESDDGSFSVSYLIHRCEDDDNEYDSWVSERYLGTNE